MLDPQLRVRGIGGLRVIDASAFPSLTTVNPVVAVLMLAERGADLVHTSVGRLASLALRSRAPAPIRSPVLPVVATARTLAGRSGAHSARSASSACTGNGSNTHQQPRRSAATCAYEGRPHDHLGTGLTADERA